MRLVRAEDRTFIDAALRFGVSLPSRQFPCRLSSGIPFAKAWGKAIFARPQPHGELGWRAAGRRTHAQPEWPERTVPRSRVPSRQANLRISAATATLRELPRSARRPQRAWESDSKRAAERATGERTLRRRAHPPRVRPPSMCRARSRPPGDSPSVEAAWRQPSVPSPDIPGHKQAARNRLGDVGAAGEDGGGDTLRHALPAGCDAGLESTECRGAAPGGPRIEFGARPAESAVPLEERPEVPRSEQGRCKVVEEAEAGEHDGIGAVIPRQQENPHSRGIESTASSRPSLPIIPHVRPLSSFGSVTAPSTPVRMKPAMIPIPPAQSAASFLFPGNEESRRHSASAERGLDPFGDAAQGGSVIRLVREHASGPFPAGGVGRCAGGILPPDDLRADTRPRRRFEANPGHQAIAGIPRFQPGAKWPPASFGVPALFIATIRSSSSRPSSPRSHGEPTASSRASTRSSTSSGRESHARCAEALRRRAVRGTAGSQPANPAFRRDSTSGLFRSSPIEEPTPDTRQASARTSRCRGSRSLHPLQASLPRSPRQGSGRSGVPDSRPRRMLRGPIGVNPAKSTLRLPISCLNNPDHPNPLCEFQSGTDGKPGRPRGVSRSMSD